MKCAVLALCLVACRSHEPPPKQPPPDPLAVELLSPGAEPRRPIHYALAKGTHVPFELAIDASLKSGGLGGDMPTFAFDLDLEVTDVLPDGRMVLRTTIADAVARDRPGEQVQASAVANRLAQIKGLAITATLSPDGKLAAGVVDARGGKLADETNQQIASLTQAFEHVAMPLPTVPVGIGARWRTTRDLEENGLHTSTTNTIDLTAIDGDKLTFSLATEIHAADQKVAQQGVDIDVSHLAGTGSGQGTIDLAHFVMTGELSAAMHADMTAAGEASAMDLSMKTTITPR